MASLLYRLGKTAYRRWPIFLAAWLVAMVGLGTVAATMAKPMSDSFSIPGIASEKAADLQAELFPTSVNAFDQAGATVVVAAPEGHSLAEPTYRAQVDALVADLADGPADADRRRSAAGQPGGRGCRHARPDRRRLGEGRDAQGAGRGQRRGAASALARRPGRADQLELRRGLSGRRRGHHPGGRGRRDGTRPGRTVCRWRPTAPVCSPSRPAARPSWSVSPSRSSSWS